MAGTTKKIAVIGGGYTGLVAAYRLAKAGHKVTILERSDTIGGLASGFTVEGANLERAYHHLFRTDTDIIAMADELGVGDKLQWHTSSIATYYGGKLYPFVTALDLLRFKPLHFHNRLRLGLVGLYLQKTSNWQRFKKVTAYEWMRRAAGDQVTKVIWEPLLRGKFSEYYDKVAMAWLWARVHIRANSKQPGDSREKLGYFQDGFQNFTDALESALRDAKANIRTGVQLQSIDSDTKGVRLTFADGRTERFDSCLATVPSHVFANLTADSNQASKAYQKQLQSIDYLGARLIIFSSPQALSQYYWHNINDVNIPFLVFIQHTRLIDAANYNGQHVYYLATYAPHDSEQFNCSDQELEDRWFKDLRKIFPDFDRKKIRQKYHFKFANAQHIADTDYERKIPAFQTPLPHVYLANFSQIYPEDRGTNYAVREGNRIAKLILTRETRRKRA